MSRTHQPRTTRRGVLLGAAAASSAALLSRRATAQPPTVNVGVILPLSGANAQFGINSRNGIELVADEINAAGGIKSLGGAKINLVVADSTSTPTTAATVAQRLITQNEVRRDPRRLRVVADHRDLGGDRAARHAAPDHVLRRPDHRPRLQEHLPGRRQGVGHRQGAVRLHRSPSPVRRAKGSRRVAIMYEDTAYGTSQAGRPARQAPRRPASRS